MNNVTEEKSKIIFLKADANYTVFFLDNGTKHVSAYNLKKHEEAAELKSFVRVNRAYLLNPKHIIKTEIKIKSPRLLCRTELKPPYLGGEAYLKTIQWLHKIVHG